MSRLTYILLGIGLCLILSAAAENRIQGDPVVIASGNLNVGDADTDTLLKLSDGSANYACIDVPALGADYTLTLPSDDGDATEQLTTDGAGNLSWEAAGAGGGAPDDAPYITQALDAGLSAERVITAGDMTGLTDGGANSTMTIGLHHASEAEGDVVYYNGTNWTRLARGTDNQVLTATASTVNWEGIPAAATPKKIVDGDTTATVDDADTGGNAFDLDIGGTADAFRFSAPAGGTTSQLILGDLSTDPMIQGAHGVALRLYGSATATANDRDINIWTQSSNADATIWMRDNTVDWGDSDSSYWTFLSAAANDYSEAYSGTQVELNTGKYDFDYIINADPGEAFYVDGGTGQIQFNNAYTFPTADGTLNYVLATDGAGALSFQAVSALGGSSKWTDAGTFTYLAATADDLVVGSNAVATAPLYFDVSDYALYLGVDNTADGKLALYNNHNGSLALVSESATDDTYGWPNAYPAANDSSLVSTTLGVMSWLAPVWHHTGTEIHPATANDYIKVQIGAPVGAAPVSGAIRVHTESTQGIAVITDTGPGVSAATSSITVGHDAIQGVAYGSTNGVYGVSAAGYGVQGDSATSHGVVGNSAGGNTSYGVLSNDGTFSQGYYDVSDEASVANPPANAIRIWAAADGMAYSQTSGGIIACMTSQGKVEHAAAGGLDATDATASGPTNAHDCNLTWKAIAIGTDTVAPVTYTNVAAWSDPTSYADDNASLTDNYGHWAWSANYRLGPPPLFTPARTQSTVGVGSSFKLFSGDAGTTACKAARGYARVRVTDISDFNDIILVLSDATGANSAHAHLAAGMSDATWYEGATAITDISAWTGPLRATVWFYGDDYTAVEARDMDCDLEYVACEQYAN
jgi:hypothetical protein